MKKTDILGVKIDCLTLDQVLEKTDSLLLKNHQLASPKLNSRDGSPTTNHQSQIIVTANPEIVLIAQRYENYREILNNADLTVADGGGLLWAGEYLNTTGCPFNCPAYSFFKSVFRFLFRQNDLKTIPQKITGVDLMSDICKQAVKNNKAVYFFGGRDNVARECSEVFKKQLPDLMVAGFMDAPEVTVAKEKNNLKINCPEIEKVLAQINEAKPDVLFVALGAPKQELFLNEYLSKTSTVKIAMGVGGAFDFWAGKVKRAPQILKNFHLEWLWRLFNEPWRLKRIFNATAYFVFSVVKYRILNR